MEDRPGTATTPHRTETRPLTFKEQLELTYKLADHLDDTVFKLTDVSPEVALELSQRYLNLGKSNATAQIGLAREKNQAENYRYWNNRFNQLLAIQSAHRNGDNTLLKTFIEESAQDYEDFSQGIVSVGEDLTIDKKERVFRHKMLARNYGRIAKALPS